MASPGEMEEQRFRSVAGGVTGEHMLTAKCRSLSPQTRVTPLTRLRF
jgi:hypothetical protein